MSKSAVFNNRLSRRILVYVLLCSSFLSICSTLIQLSVDFQDSMVTLEERFENVESSYLQSISTSLWDFNEPLVNQQIKGIVKLPDIRYVKITTGFGKVYEFGDKDMVPEKEVEFPISYGENDIGVISVRADYQDIYQKLRQKAGFIVTTEFVKIFIVALLIIFIIHSLIIRHIYKITRYSQELSSENLDSILTLDSRPDSKDELDQLADALNAMRMTLKDDIVKLGEAENALLKLNGELEVKVHDRTAKLAESNKQLQKSLDDLTLAKDQLVQSEKMASLGQLVAGVAHEVNTPLGICVTSITALREKVLTLTKSVEQETLTRSELSTTLELLIEYQQIIERSLNKAVDLIRGFKSVAVEQHTDPELSINLSQHVNDIVNTVKTLFKRRNYGITVKVDEDFSFLTYPSAWNQILTNFLMNSHHHGFEGRDTGEIFIEFTEQEGTLVMIYKDDGNGIAPEVKNKIFDPFVTTKRGQGGSGLGMNIVFNLVNSKLGGSIEMLDLAQGCGFKVVVPIHNQPTEPTLELLK